MRFLVLFFCCFLSFGVMAKHKYPEKYYQQKYCVGEMEVKLADKTRIDCLMDEYAIEFDFANKWAEAIGQSLHYAFMSGKKAGIVLIVENDKQLWQVAIAENLCRKYNIKMWVING